MIYGIWAEDEQGLIGQNDRMPWRLPAEQAHFKAVTMGQVILMGRKTFEGMKGRILPGRTTIVLTHDQTYTTANPAVLILHSRQAVLDWYHQQDKDLYITGGSQVFRTFEPDMEGIFRTIVHGQFQGDAYFPADFDWSKFQEVDQQFHPADPQNLTAFTVKTYQENQSF